MGRWFSVGVVVFVIGCAGDAATTRKHGELAPASTFAATEAALAGHRCGNGTCVCRDQGDAEELTPPAEGTKRFEVRLTVTDGEGWLTFGPHKLVKKGPIPEACWYLDVAPGDVPLALTAQGGPGSGGVGVNVRVREYKVDGASWYDAFKWQCGDPEACSLEALDELKAAVQRDRKLLRDSCSSVRPKGVTWESGRVADATHPGDVRLAATLFVAKWTPSYLPDASDCPEK